MYLLTNDVTGQALKLTDKVAENVFGLTEAHQHLVCLPAAKIMKAKNAQLTIRVDRKTSNAKKIAGTCVVRMGGIGDLAALSSTLVKLKKKDPETSITLATLRNHIDLVQGMNGVDRVIDVDELKRYRFDKVLDLRYSVEPANIGPGSLTWKDYTCKDRSDNFDMLCGVNGKAKYFNLPVDKVFQADMKARLKKYPKPWVGINPTCTSYFRAMPPDYIDPLIDMLPGTVVLFGKTEIWNDELRHIIGDTVLNFLDNLTLPQMIALCSVLDVIITPDTGTLHIGAALKRKTLGLFGNIDPATRATYYKTVTTLFPKGALKCVPCWDIPGACECDKPGAECMRLHTPEIIAKEVKAMVK